MLPIEDCAERSAHPNNFITACNDLSVSVQFEGNDEFQPGISRAGEKGTLDLFDDGDFHNPKKLDDVSRDFFAWGGVDVGSGVCGDI